MKIYLVGGAVRDKLLGLPNADRDWVVVGATAQTMLEQGYLQVGKDFPVFLHPRTREEYALARRERKTGRGHTAFAVDATPDVTLEEDLLRRDLTINALAEDEDGKLIDPYGGRRDLEAGVLRHVSDAFSEDPLRVLRVARFAARFADRQFHIASETQQLMTHMSGSGELEHLPPERLWREMEIALREKAPDVFITVLRECGALRVLLPEVDALFGIPQSARDHPEMDTGLHTLLALQQACALTPDPAVRYAVLLHDLGKGATPREEWPRHPHHDELGEPLVEQVGKRLRVPKEFQSAARHLARHHVHCHQLLEASADTLLQLLEALDAFRRPAQLTQFVLGCEASARGRAGLESRPYPQAALLRQAFDSACAVDINTLLQTNGLLPGQQESSLGTGLRQGEEKDGTAKQTQALRIRETIRQARVEAICKMPRESGNNHAG